MVSNVIKSEQKNNQSPKAGEQMIRFKRMLAFFLDWMLCITPFIILFFVVGGIMTANPSIGDSPLIVVLLLPMLLLIPAAFGVILLRDAIFKRSPAKRLLKLYIYDAKTLQPATGEQCVLKNLFFFFYPIDGLILLFSGKSLGERVADVVVTSEQERETLLEKQTIDEQPSTTNSKHGTVKTLLIVGGIIVGSIFALLLLIQLILHNTKNSEEYKLAHHYLITSEAYQEISAEEKDIRFTSYKFSGDGKGNGSASLVLVVKSNRFTVILHKENDAWRVCEECTEFE